jgi:hypothetical protein
VDEVERLIRLFDSRADAPAPARRDILLDLRRHRDPRIVPFLLQVVLDGDEAGEVRIDVVKQLRSVPLVADERSAVAHAIARVLVDDGDAGLRLQAALALGCFADVEGIPAALGSVALDTGESLDLRFSAFTSLERAGATPECVGLVRKLTSDETLGRAAGALLATWRVEP